MNPHFRTEPLADALGLRVRANGLSFADVAAGWIADADFRSHFTEVLAGVPYLTFRWECPPLTTANLSQPFECVLLPSPEIDRPADASAFEDHIAHVTDEVVTFPNLGGDATLIVPVPRVGGDCYAHLAAFLRDAPDGQRHALWEAVGRALQHRVGTKPVWLNTAGAGVPWLHVRLDDRPKYYRYAPYRGHKVS